MKNQCLFLFVLLFAYSFSSGQAVLIDSSKKNEHTRTGHTSSVDTLDKLLGGSDTTVSRYPAKTEKIDWVDLFAKLAQIVATIITAIALWYAHGSLVQLKVSIEELKKTNTGRIDIDIFNEVRDPKWEKCRKMIEDSVKNKTVTDFDKVKDYSHLLNHLGFLLEHEYVSVKSCYEMIGNSIIHSWDLLSEQIIERRRTSIGRRYYQYHFQYLAYQMKNYKDEGDAHIDKLFTEMGWESSTKPPGVAESMTSEKQKDS